MDLRAKTIFVCLTLNTFTAFSQTAPGDFTSIDIFRDFPAVNGNPSLDYWLADVQRTHSWQNDDGIYQFGLTGDKRIMGDWLGTHHLQMGIFRPSVGIWALDWNDNRVP
jgi:hypothetical protein